MERLKLNILMYYFFIFGAIGISINYESLSSILLVLVALLTIYGTLINPNLLINIRELARKRDKTEIINDISDNDIKNIKKVRVISLLIIGSVLMSYAPRLIDIFSKTHTYYGFTITKKAFYKHKIPEYRLYGIDIKKHSDISVQVPRHIFNSASIGNLLVVHVSDKYLIDKRVYIHDGNRNVIDNNIIYYIHKEMFIPLLIIWLMLFVCFGPSNNKTIKIIIMIDGIVIFFGSINIITYT